MFERSEKHTRGEFSHKGRKMLLGPTKVSLTIAFGQYKYGDEVIAQAYSKEGLVTAHNRRADGYSRSQVYLGPADESTAQMLEEAAKEIRNHLSGTNRKGPQSPL